MIYKLKKFVLGGSFGAFEVKRKMQCGGERDLQKVHCTEAFKSNENSENADIVGDLLYEEHITVRKIVLGARFRPVDLPPNSRGRAPC
jgi:hypothetical protein